MVSLSTCGVLVTVFAAVLVAPAAAQTEKGAIVGTVTDTTGAVLPAATVTVTNLGTGVVQTYTTNVQGVYEAPFLSPGTYKVTVTLAGFTTSVLESVAVNVGARLRADAMLAVSGVAAEVTVQAQPPLVQTETASVGQIVSERQLAELPTGDRNIYEFLLLSSTVAQPPGGNAPAFRLESGGSFALSGTRPSSLTFKIDGLPNTDPGFGTPTITPSLDAVQEFQVQNNAYSAEYEGIGQINVATKPGTNVLHGTLSEFIRNEALQPRHPLLNRRTRLRFNQFGGTLGGPVWPLTERTFFFVSYEGRRHDTLGVARAFVPTAAQRAGDFSADLGGCVTVGGRAVSLLLPTGQASGACVRQGQIFDPLTSMPNPLFDPGQPVSAFNPQFIRQPFPDNRIPAARVSQVARQVIDAQLPLPNFGDVANNFTGRGGTRVENDQYAVRVDYAASARNRFYGRLAIQNNVRINQPLIPFTTKDLQGKGRVFSSTWTRVFGAGAVNEFRAGFVRGIYGDSVASVDPKQFGIRNTLGEGLPRFSLSAGNLNYGGFSGSILQETQDTYQLANTFALVRGRHAMKTGIELSYNEFTNAERFGANGTGTFSGLYTKGNNALGAVREHSIADFMLGLAESTSLNRPGVANLQNMPWAVYVQDDWKMNDRVSLAMGLRYELHQPWKEAASGGSRVDLSGGGRLFVVDPEVAQLSDTPLVVCCAQRRSGPTDRNDFAPRVSIVVRPFARDNLAVRAGYGLFYSDMTQFFAWRQHEPLRGLVYQGAAGDFVNPGSRLEDLFPENRFITGGGVRPFFPAGVTPAALNNTPVTSFSTMGSRQTPYAHQWSISVQREMLPQMLLDVTYQGSVGRNLPTQWIFNQPTPSPVPVNFASADPAANPYLRRPYACCTITSFAVANILQSEYNAVTVRVDKRFARGYQVLSSYTWSRSIDEGSEVFALGSTFNILANSRDPRMDRGRSTFDLPHRWVTSGSVELPFGRGKRFLSDSALAHALVGGFRLAGVFTLQSGFPFSPNIRNQRANTGYTLSTERGDLVGDPYFSDEEWKQRVAEWKRNGDTRLFLINPAAISLNYPMGTFGNIPRNFFRTPFGRRLDLSAAKATDLPGRARLELRVDVLNAMGERLHRMDLQALVFANNLLTHAFVGSIPSYGELFNPRLIQIGAKIVF